MARRPHVRRVVGASDGSGEGAVERAGGSPGSPAAVQRGRLAGVTAVVALTVAAALVVTGCAAAPGTVGTADPASKGRSGSTADRQTSAGSSDPAADTQGSTDPSPDTQGSSDAPGSPDTGPP